METNGKRKKSLINAAKTKKPGVESGWVIATEKPKMHILYLKGPVHLADVDTVLCPVTDQFMPLGTSASLIKEEETDKGVVSDSTVQNLAQKIIDHLTQNGYQSFGLSLACKDIVGWKEFSFSLVAHMWKYSGSLKLPIRLCCFAEHSDIFANLDEYLSNVVKIEKLLDPVVLEHSDMQVFKESSISIRVHEGSILDFDDKILKNLMTRCLKEAAERKYESIAFPALGTGTLGYPPCLVAKTMFDAVYEFGRTRKGKALKEVHFVLFGDKEFVQLFRNIIEWKKSAKRENTEFGNYGFIFHLHAFIVYCIRIKNIKLDLPPRYILFLERDLETRVIVSDRAYIRNLSYNELRVVMTEKEDNGIPLQTHVNALLYELKGLRDSVDQVNVINRSKKQPTRHNYIKVVRLFITSDEYCAFENEYASSNRRNDEVVGSKPNVKDVMKTVMQDMSSIEEKILIDKAKEELEKYKETEICLEMNEDDYTALLYITSEDTWRGDVRHFSYARGKATLQLETSANVEKLANCIESEINKIHQLASSEVVPPKNFKINFQHFNQKLKMLNKASKYEQAQQAKYMVEVNLGMVQQGGGRRNRKFASPDEIGPGPVASPSSSTEVTIRGGLNFKTREGILVYVYSAGIGNLKVDTLVNAANRDLMHGGGIAYHISSAAGYALDKECDNYVQSNGPLSVGTCCSTTAGNLPYKSIIHAVGPMWHSYQHDRKQHCLDDLKKTILSALEEAESHKFRSIAIPSISSGIFGVPKELCAKQYFRAVVEYSGSSPSSSVREIHFIDKDRGMCNLVQKTFEKEFGYKGQQM
ncbi:PARP10_14_15 [Mytilus edulis]|uniref:PARP10_14_15 n=1 Tax=Mytilus edulis TaxID=6550 RepID=A0A8S3SQ48_MYTED|nr:PARP10_14_15 [Mytilus edulis]